MLPLSVILGTLAAFSAPDVGRYQLDVDAIAEALPLVVQALEIHERALTRERRHNDELRRQGVAEVAASSSAVKYEIDTAGLGELLLDDWGELYVDRRFVTDEELKVIRRIEQLIARCFPQIAREAKRQPPRRCASAAGLPIFRGFEDARYQQHDALIARLVKEFNADKASWCGGTAAQSDKIEPLMAALVKAHMIEESGGNGPKSLAAWERDPLQVNVPGDWGAEKELVGLMRPEKRNEGKVENNVRAAIKYLVRKGFSASARPAAERPKGVFDGWLKALRRYNGRRDRTDTDRYYSDEYADKIVRRAQNPDRFEPIEIKLAKP